MKDQAFEISALKAENGRQQLEISRQSAVISRLEELMAHGAANVNEPSQPGLC